MAICATCGNDLTDDAVQCSICSTPLAAVEAAALARNDGPVLELARFPRRAAGFAIDAGLVLVPVLIVPWLLLLVPFVWVFFNSVGWSPGKRLLGTRIVTESGGRPGFGRGVVRTITASLSYYSVGAGFLWSLWDEERQTWHDKFSGTHVVKWGDGHANAVRNSIERSAAQLTSSRLVNAGPFGDGSLVERAEFMVRWGGYIVDWVLFVLAQRLVGEGLYAQLVRGESGVDRALDPRFDLSSGLAWFAVVLPLLWFFNSIGWSPGKRAMTLRTVGRDLRPPGVGGGFNRTVGSVLSGLPLGLGYVWARWDEENQTWHDKMAGTYVVQRRPLRPVRWV